MNIVERGSHEATDWVLVKIRAHARPIEITVMPEGLLRAREFVRNRPAPRFGKPAGVFGPGIRYCDLHAELDYVRREMVGRVAA